MISIKRGNLLKTDTEALVNTVNCVGHMGRGIALQFKKAFPENNKSYVQACNADALRPGKMFIYETGDMWNPKYIINFPTKRHWRGKSKLEDIKSGLEALVQDVKRLGITSIAVPPLGCGLGGLKWDTVRSLIEKAFSELPDVQVLLYEPAGAPEAKTMPVRTKKPHMTVARALFIKLMKQYSEFAYRLTLLEIQKLAYFLQASGENLKLNYEAGPYGPYAHNLNKVLEILEGHYTQGYGDSQKPDVEIELLPKASEAADKFLSKYTESIKRLKKLDELIEGFETPYGMELLSSIHWIMHHDSCPADNVDEAIKIIHNWTDRKKRMFTSKHINIAWHHLENLGWLQETTTN